MDGYKTHSTEENDRLLREIHEELMQLRAATQVYTALLERFLAADPSQRSKRPSGAADVVAPLKEAS